MQHKLERLDQMIDDAKIRAGLARSESVAKKYGSKQCKAFLSSWLAKPVQSGQKEECYDECGIAWGSV